MFSSNQKAQQIIEYLLLFSAVVLGLIGFVANHDFFAKALDGMINTALESGSGSGEIYTYSWVEDTNNCPCEGPEVDDGCGQGIRTCAFICMRSDMKVVDTSFCGGQSHPLAGATCWVFSGCCGNGDVDNFSQMTPDETEQCDKKDGVIQPEGSTCKSADSNLYPVPDGLDCVNCKFDTRGCAKCGDGEVDIGLDPDNPWEQCEVGGESCTILDGMGFEGGTLECNPNCTYNLADCYKCGDGVQNDDNGEDCDGGDLGGAESCVDAGFHDSGTLSCTEGCKYTGCAFCGDGDIDIGPDPADPWEQCDGSEGLCTDEQRASGTCDVDCYGKVSSAYCSNGPEGMCNHGDITVCAGCQYDLSGCSYVSANCTGINPSDPNSAYEWCVSDRKLLESQDVTLVDSDECVINSPTDVEKCYVKCKAPLVAKDNGIGGLKCGCPGDSQLDDDECVCSGGGNLALTGTPNFSKTGGTAFCGGCPYGSEWFQNPSILNNGTINNNANDVVGACIGSGIDAHFTNTITFPKSNITRIEYEAWGRAYGQSGTITTSVYQNGGWVVVDSRDVNIHDGTWTAKPQLVQISGSFLNVEGVKVYVEANAAQNYCAISFIYEIRAFGNPDCCPGISDPDQCDNVTGCTWNNGCVSD